MTTFGPSPVHAGLRFVGLLVPLMLLGASQAASAPRLVSLAPHLTELAYAAGVGDRLVGAVEWSDYPEPARTLPRIGDAFRFDLERIVRLDATAALAWQGGTPADAIDTLRALGVEVHVIAIHGLDDIAGAIERLGRIGGTDAAAAAGAWRTRLQTLRARPRPQAVEVPVFYQISARPLFTLGGRHVINEVLSLCGARNIFADLDSTAANVDLEALLARDPLVILAGNNNPEPESDQTERDTGEPIAGDWPNRLPELRAVRCGHLRAVNPDLLVRPGPRLLDGAEALCRWIDTRVRRASESDCRP